MRTCICGRKGKIKKAYFPTNFVGIKDNKPSYFYYCSKECLKKANKNQVNAIIPLAYLDRSMNYCQYFVREKGNNGYYINGDVKIKCTGLDDYKTEFVRNIPYRLHDRYRGQAPDWMFEDY